MSFSDQWRAAIAQLRMARRHIPVRRMALAALPIVAVALAIVSMSNIMLWAHLYRWVSIIPGFGIIIALGIAVACSLILYERTKNDGSAR